MCTQVKSDQKHEIVAFVEQHLASLDEQRIELFRSTSGDYIAELINAGPEPDTVSA